MSYIFNRWTLVSFGIVVGFAYYYSNYINKGITTPYRRHILYGDMRRSAVVIGATGATGESLVRQLLRSSEWGKVTVIHRRLMDSLSDLTQNELSKLHQHKVNMSQLTNEDTMKLFNDHDVTFCTLGTTRDQAKTAEQFRKVDLYMVRDAGIASRKASIPQFSLLTASGSNANVYANDYKLFHGLLYMKTKGQAENEIINLDFPRTSIFRPGMLNRGNKARAIEKWGSYILPSTHVDDVAASMIYDAESEIFDVNKHEKPIFYSEKDIQFVSKL